MRYGISRNVSARRRSGEAMYGQVKRGERGGRGQ
jgi:hypothetical protein